MSLHKNPKYQIPELIAALKEHRLDVGTPSQLSDAFRIGWLAGSQVKVSPTTLGVQEVENLAKKHESFGFGQVGARGLTTHGFDPEGLYAFAVELLTTVAKTMPPENDGSADRELHVRLLQRGYSEGWSDHKQDRQHGMTPAKLDAAIRDALNLSRR